MNLHFPSPVVNLKISSEICLLLDSNHRRTTAIYLRIISTKPISYTSFIFCKTPIQNLEITIGIPGWKFLKILSDFARLT